MLAQQTKGPESNGDNGGRSLPPSRKEKRPKTFMFIDSSNGGINAKPDRVVRSFVMKSARNKKPWSTRPRNPKTDTLTIVEATTPRLLPIDPHRSSEVAATDWVAACIQSPIGAPFIYAVLTSSARATSLDSEVYKWRAIAEVNRLLTDSHKNTDDTTIATVLMLLALEEADLADPRKKGDERRCSVRVKEAHLNGLKTMIGQRGGLAALGQNRYPGLFDIVSTITVFISDLTAWYETGICPVDSFELQKHASLLMYRLFDWHEQHTNNQNEETRQVDESICLALLIFIVNATEPNAFSFGSRLSKTVNKLHLALERVPLHHWSHAPDMLLWTLTMGALGAKTLPRGSRASTSTGPELSFFMQLSPAAVSDRSFKLASMNLQLLLDKLKSCLWMPSIFDERLKRLWVSMGLCKPEVVDVEDTSSSSEGEREQLVDDEYALGQSTTMRFFKLEGKKRVKREPPV
ncbi:hypothetical protein N0V83_000460 [Neocucurbitaria cava]|uniref:Uncharacterized protein n=1 Tax=Neocucurbitaria cava TaxID=798079 RepID=A0A9W9CS13_9PLEO|nr:hypothetical protein N0V83_000460 [Neocucurbitaria cava]